MSYSERDLEILYSDRYLIAVNKPAGLVVQGARFEGESLLELTKKFIKKMEKKEGNVFLAVVHRLDKPVSGVCLFARRSKTAKKLHEIITKKRFFKIYVAKVEGAFQKSEGLLVDYLIYENGRVEVVEKTDEREKSKRAVTFYKLLRRDSSTSLLLLSPLTGRKHQLRIALAKRGHPIVGDKKYGARKRVLGGRAILLHALMVALPHPYFETSLEIVAPLPPYFSVADLDKSTVVEFLNKIKLNLQDLFNQTTPEGGQNVSSKDLDKSGK